MVDRVEEGTKLVLFISHLAANEHQIFAYTNGSWFKLRGVDETTKLRALFLQGEPYLRRTFHGEVDRLVKLIDDFTAGTTILPELDKAAKPGLGPTLNALIPAPPAEVAASDQIELGRAWRGDGNVKASDSSKATQRYAIAGFLVAAVVGLLFMMTRSSPEVAS
jgi:hypothetical protein